MRTKTYEAILALLKASNKRECANKPGEFRRADEEFNLMFSELGREIDQERQEAVDVHCAKIVNIEPR